MKLNTLPQKLIVGDYHEFDTIKDHLRILAPEIKVKEIGFNGDYLGVAYVGSLTDKKNKQLIEEIKTESDKYEFDY